MPIDSRRGFCTRRSALQAGIGVAVSLVSGCSFRSTDRQAESTTTKTEPQLAGWPQYGYDPQRTGFTPNRTGPTANPTVAWSDDIGSSAPVIADGRIFVGDETGSIAAIDVESGTKEWSQQLSDKPVPAPVVSDETIYVGSEASFYALDASSGSVEWEQSFDQKISGAAPVFADGTIYFTTAVPDAGGHVETPGVESETKASVIALDATTGTTEWTFSEFETDTVDCIPAVANGRLHVAARNDVYALDADSGAVEWHVDWPDCHQPRPSTLDGSIISPPTKPSEKTRCKPKSERSTRRLASDCGVHPSKSSSPVCRRRSPTGPST
jgi:hypothetical protein